MAGKVFSGIGGQAVMEGVMMRSKDEYAVAVRLSDYSIHVEKKRDNFGSSKWLKVPIIRGVISFIYSLVTGIRALMTSASFIEDDEETKEKRSHMTAEEIKKAEDKELWGSFFFSLILALAIFFMLPYGLSKLFQRLVSNKEVVIAFEGILRVVIFLAYIVLISKLEDIRRVYMYHGAEHKCINCIENGMPLTVENVKKSTRLHKRCGTSFIFIVMVISIFVFMFIRSENPLIQILLRFALIPVVAGISYEFIRLAGRSENALVNLLSKPGLALQKLTTQEPDDSMIEVGIASVEAVFDWKKFQEEHQSDFAMGNEVHH